MPGQPPHQPGPQQPPGQHQTWPPQGVPPQQSGPQTWPPQGVPPQQARDQGQDGLGEGTVRLPYTPDMLPDVEQYETATPKSGWWWVIVVGGLLLLVAVVAVVVIFWVRSSGL
ncbi:hypothetical protein ACIBKY_53275 [Nonomuraea sp. NPDC050394]|uniref:hypothetical protein n=1 Tax=Nonomuraea sp. NPDC050394 TaxID=3364363 RepID=UPI0037A84910